jgi:hypothetical protein
MKDIYKYSILKEVGLVIQFHQNKLTFEGIKKLKSDIINDKDFNPYYVFIIDVRKAEIIMTRTELEDYGDWVVENLKLKGLRRLALLTENPDQVVKSTIYTLNVKVSPLNYNIFSSLEGAIPWLNIDTANIDLIRAEINKLVE